ncbi:hypothetical protein LTR94_035014, partial [Friedmanniomyces endolithicus]
MLGAGIEVVAEDVGDAQMIQVGADPVHPAGRDDRARQVGGERAHEAHCARNFLDSLDKAAFVLGHAGVVEIIGDGAAQEAFHLAQEIRARAAHEARHRFLGADRVADR